MDFDSAIQLLTHSDGYALWVGAGVAIHLARAGDGGAPTWGEVARRLESAAGMPPSAGDFPKRLEECLKALGRARFQKEVRAATLAPLCDAVLRAGRRYQDPAHCVPPEVRQIAALGALANPIVNFNVELLTSIALASPGGPYAIRCFNPPVDELDGLPRTSVGSADGKRFRRAVYHPHGALESSGICVLAESEYASMHGTLAFELATHAAFASRLVIAGMSLEDGYLRSQLERFMPQLSGVVWFVGAGVRPDILDWSKAHGVEVVRVASWSAFWSAVGTELPSPSELDLVLSWQAMLAHAIDSLNPREYLATIDGFRRLGAPESQLDVWRRLAELAGISMAELQAAPSEVWDRTRRDILLPTMEAIWSLTVGAQAKAP